MSKRQWDEAHAAGGGGVPSRLYTDENPATTIKGTGFRDRAIALRTIELTSQRGARYKQYWTIRAMRERAAHHPHPTDGMRDAIAVFDDWVGSYQEPTEEGKRAQREEWEEFKRMCESDANRHRYGSDPSREELQRASNDSSDGQRSLVELLAQFRPDVPPPLMVFRLTSYVALFGGPGLHGYGEHTVDKEGGSSQVGISGLDGLKELIGGARTLRLGLVGCTKIQIQYDRKQELATAVVEQSHATPTLPSLWGRTPSNADSALVPKKLRQQDCQEGREPDAGQSVTSWACSVCTYIHAGATKSCFLACEICGAKRDTADSSGAPLVAPQPTSKATSSPSTWGSLRPPSAKDIAGSRKRRKGLDRPPPIMDYLVVLDFEWTADNKKKMEPVAEITQFPSVALRLSENANKNDRDPVEVYSSGSSIPIPDDLMQLPAELSPACRRDAWCISLFDSFVQPTLNPILTEFSVELTGITQDDVDKAPTFDQVLRRYMNWLHSIDLVDEKGNRKSKWAFCIWGDCDIMSTLRLELQHKSIDFPACFDRWINLKDDAIFKRHYKREPRGGLRTCVESVGVSWEGRAHNGLVDSINTAKIVRNMAQTGFRFTRSTRGLDQDGIPFGQRNRRSKR